MEDTFSTKARVTKLTEQKRSFKINTDLITISVSVVIMTCAALFSVTMYNINDRNNMAKNIEAAITKGIDPLSVKCAYETTANTTCISYALAQGNASNKK